MIATLTETLRGQLLDRRRSMTTALSELGEAEDLVRLIQEVDRTLERLGTDAFGRCVACGEPFADDELRARPTVQYCLCDLSATQQAALERDLSLAWSVQASLLPDAHLEAAGWETHYRFQPAGPVSGDYCDVVEHDDWLYFLVGDVSGKGIAASCLMAHLSALVRSTLESAVPVADLVDRIDRHISERTPDSHFVTLVCGRANAAGAVELCNAGHCPPLRVGPAGCVPVESTGFPIGIGQHESRRTIRTELDPGDAIVLYTDGITEARNPASRMYGVDGLVRTLDAHGAGSPIRLADACLRDLDQFQGGTPRGDDLTLMVVRRTG